MINLDSILKSRDITLLTKIHIVKAMVFSVVMYRCESWTIKKTEWRRTDAFKLVLEKTLGIYKSDKTVAFESWHHSSSYLWFGSF